MGKFRLLLTRTKPELLTRNKEMGQQLFAPPKTNFLYLLLNLNQCQSLRLLGLHLISIGPTKLQVEYTGVVYQKTSDIITP